MSVLVALAAFALAPPPAAAAVQSPSPDDTIVVTGQKESRDAVEQFVKALTAVPANRQLSRFEHSVCPAVFGLAAPQASAVVSRIRLVAKSVGIVVGGDHCSPNVLLLVTSDKKVFLQTLRHNSSDDFGITDGEFHKLERQPGPAAAWQVQGPEMTADGQDLEVDPSMGQVVNRSIAPASRINVPVHPQFDAAIVVVERKALVGLTTTQLADYTAIRALTGADPAKLANSSAPTILQVLDVPIGGSAPITMTSWDFSFLQGYYDARRDLRTASQRSAITDSMTGKLHKPNGK